jgi:SAM-dependent methyltransferase
MFPKELRRVGIDPAKNIDWSNLDKSITIVNDYFPSKKLKKYKFKIITTTAMFYDLDNPNTAVSQIKEILAKDGVLCIQVSYLYDTIRDMNFYDICHEHLEYYSLKTLSSLMEKNGMEVFDASTNFVNGGSLRIMVAHKKAKRPKSANLEYLLLKEKVLQLENSQTYDIFSKLIEINTKRIKKYIENQKGLVIGLGASTKGNVMLQLCGIGKKVLPYISERNPFKVGLRTLGTDMLLISEEKARKLQPDCMFVIPWNFKAEILEREKEYVRKGGKLLFIMPYPYVIDKNGETRL